MALPDITNQSLPGFQPSPRKARIACTEHDLRWPPAVSLLGGVKLVYPRGHCLTVSSLLPLCHLASSVASLLILFLPAVCTQNSWRDPVRATCHPSAQTPSSWLPHLSSQFLLWRTSLSCVDTSSPTPVDSLSSPDTLSLAALFSRPSLSYPNLTFHSLSGNFLALCVTFT